MNSLSSILKSKEQASWLQYGAKWLYWDELQETWTVRKQSYPPDQRKSTVLYWGPIFVEAIDVLTRKEKE